MSERVSFSALRDTLNSSEYEEQPVLSNPADATLRRQEKEIQRLKKANFNLKLQVFHLEEKLGLLPNDFEGDATNKSTLSMEDSGLQSPKANLLQVLEEKEREVSQRDELLKKARKVIFSLQEKIKELYERNKSMHNTPVVKESNANGDTDSFYSKRDEKWPDSLSETFQVFQKRWNYLAENFPVEISQIPKEAVVSRDWTALENIFHHVIETLPIFQELLRNSDKVDLQSLGSSYENQKSPKFARDYKSDSRNSTRTMKAGTNTDSASPLEIDMKTANGHWRSPERPQRNQITTPQKLDLEPGQLSKLQEVLLRFVEIPELRLPQLSTRSNVSNDEIVRFLKMLYDQTYKLQEKILKCQEEIHNKEAEVEDVMMAKNQVEDSMLALRDEREHLLQQVESFETQLDETVYYYRNENEKLSEELQKVKEELDEAQKYYENELNRQTEELEQRKEHYQAEIVRISEELDKTKNNLQESQEYYQQILDERVNELNERQQSYETQIARLSHELERLTKELEEKQEGYEAEIARLTEELEQTNSQLEETERHYQLENERLGQELNLRTRELQEIKEDNEESICRLSQEIERLRCQLAELEEQHHNENTRQLEEFEKQRIELEQARKEYEMEMVKLSEELQRVTNEREYSDSCYSEEISQLREQLNHETMKMIEMREEYENEVNHLSEQLKQTEQQLKDTERHYEEEKENILNQLQQVSSKLEEESLKTEHYSELSKVVEEYEQWLKVLQADTDHYYQRGQPVDCVLRRTLLSEISEQNNKLNQYELQLEKLKHDYDLLLKEKTSLSSSNQENEEENKIYREQIEMIQKEREKLEMNQEELQFQNASLKQQAHLIAQELEKYRNELTRNKDEVKRLNLKITEDATIVENLRKNNESAEHELKFMTEERDKLKKDIDVDKEQIESLSKELSLLQANLTSLEQSHRTKEDELATALYEKQQLSKQVEKVEGELAAAITKNKNQTENLIAMQRKLSEREASVENLRSELAEKEAQLQVLGKELEESSSEHEILQQRVAELESELSDMKNQVQKDSQKKSKSPEDFTKTTGNSPQVKPSVVLNDSPSEAKLGKTPLNQVTSSHQPQLTNGILTDDLRIESRLPDDSSVVSEKTELEQLLRQRDYENLVLQQEAESYYEEWKKMEKESELLRSMLQNLENEQLECKKYASELGEVIEALFEKSSSEPSSIQHNLQTCFNRLLEKFSVDAPSSVKANSECSGNVTFQDIGVRPFPSLTRKGSLLGSEEHDWNDIRDLDDTCQQVFSLFSCELQKLQEAMYQLSENVPSSMLSESDIVQLEDQLPNMIVSGHTIEFEDLSIYIQQLTQQLARFRKVALTAKQALLSEMSLQNISVYEVSQPAFGNPISELEAHFSEDAKDAKKNLNELEIISQVATETLDAKALLMENMDNLDARVESVLQSLANRLSSISEKQKSLGKKLNYRNHLPNLSIPLKQRASGENLLGIQRDSLSHKSETHTWEDVALRQIEETQRLINSAHQRLAWEKARLIQSVFGQVTE